MCNLQVFLGVTCWFTDKTHFFLLEGSQSHDNLVTLRECQEMTEHKVLHFVQFVLLVILEDIMRSHMAYQGNTVKSDKPQGSAPK